MRLSILLTLTVMTSVVGVLVSAQTPDATAAAKGNAENGKKIFTSYGCYQCHNYAAHGGRAGSRLAPNPIPFAAFSRYIRAPTNQMPPYTDKSMSDQELADIYAFLLTIPVPPAVDSIAILKE